MSQGRFPMTRVNQSSIKGKIRDLPIAPALEDVLNKAAIAAGVDTVLITSGGQPGTGGKRTRSTRHDGGRAADPELIAKGHVLTFPHAPGSPTVATLGRAAAANRAHRIGPG